MVPDPNYCRQWITDSFCRSLCTVAGSPDKQNYRETISKLRAPTNKEQLAPEPRIHKTCFLANMSLSKFVFNCMLLHATIKLCSKHSKQDSTTCVKQMLVAIHVYQGGQHVDRTGWLLSVTWSIAPDFTLNWQDRQKEHFSINISERTQKWKTLHFTFCTCDFIAERSIACFQ